MIRGGERSLRAARRVGPHGHVVGVDISESLLAIAREKAVDQSISNIELRTGDADSLDGIADASFDAATVRWGLGASPSPQRALHSLRRVLEPGAVLVAAVWAEIERVPWAFVTRRRLGAFRDVPDIDPDAPGAFLFADEGRLVRALDEAGFMIEKMEERDVDVIEAATGDEIGAWTRDLGLARLASELKEEQQVAWAAALAREVERFRIGDVIRLGGVSRVVVARRRA